MFPELTLAEPSFSKYAFITYPASQLGRKGPDAFEWTHPENSEPTESLLCLDTPGLLRGTGCHGDLFFLKDGNGITGCSAGCFTGNINPGLSSISLYQPSLKDVETG